MRVNDASTRWCFRDIAYVVERAGAGLDCIILPKVETAADVHFADRLLSQLERELGGSRRIGLEVQIESPRGLVNIESIAAASDRIETLIFGPGDFAASAGMPQLTVGAAEPAVRRRPVALRALAHPHDGARLRAAGDRRAVRADPRSRGLPRRRATFAAPRVRRQVGPAPGPDRALQRDLLAADRGVRAGRAHPRRLREGDREAGRGAVMFEGEMIDEASRKMAEQVAARGRAAGLGR